MMIFLAECPNKMLISTIDNVHVVADIYLEKEDGCLSLIKLLITFDRFSKIGSSVIYRPESEKTWFRKCKFLTL